jgi:general stress protein YciG
MSGSKLGGIKARETNKKKFGDDFYKRIGALGGKAEVPKGFALNRELASKAGRKGGTISRRNRHDS